MKKIRVEIKVVHVPLQIMSRCRTENANIGYFVSKYNFHLIFRQILIHSPLKTADIELCAYLSKIMHERAKKYNPAA